MDTVAAEPAVIWAVAVFVTVPRFTLTFKVTVPDATPAVHVVAGLESGLTVPRLVLRVQA